MVGATMERLGSGPTIQDIMRLLFWTRTATTSKLFITGRPRGAPPPSKSRFEPGEAVLALGGRSPPSEEVIAGWIIAGCFFPRHRSFDIRWVKYAGIPWGHTGRLVPPAGGRRPHSRPAGYSAWLIRPGESAPYRPPCRRNHLPWRPSHRSWSDPGGSPPDLLRQWPHHWDSRSVALPIGQCSGFAGDLSRQFGPVPPVGPFPVEYRRPGLPSAQFPEHQHRRLPGVEC